jgi:7,8-dihydropterin-6-yl-methyl-4-(beta-D-ribofuranosyl)aminobenzene 5'-phosphate synthase
MSKSANGEFRLKEVDRVELVSLMDNSLDLISTTRKKEVRQASEWATELKGKEWTAKHFTAPVAEHGFSMLVRVFDGRTHHSVLFDTGCSPEGVVANAARMGLDLREIECIIISHGHYDHFGGLLATLKVVEKEGLPIIVHEDMFKPRGVANSDGTVRRLPLFPSDDQVRPARYVKTKRPGPVADDMILVTGEIPRKTDFETGFLLHRMLVAGKWQPDPLIRDDRAIVVHVRRKGLVIVSGCAHAGIINTILCAQQITEVEEVHAIVGGFHLAGKDGESRVSLTVDRLKQFNPQLIAPSHCTGWRASCAIAQALPQSFVWGSVGNLYRF